MCPAKNIDLDLLTSIQLGPPIGKASLDQTRMISFPHLDAVPLAVWRNHSLLGSSLHIHSSICMSFSIAFPSVIPPSCMVLAHVPYSVSNQASCSSQKQSFMKVCTMQTRSSSWSKRKITRSPVLAHKEGCMFSVGLEDLI